MLMSEVYLPVFLAGGSIASRVDHHTGEIVTVFYTAETRFCFQESFEFHFSYSQPYRYR